MVPCTESLVGLRIPQGEMERILISRIHPVRTTCQGKKHLRLHQLLNLFQPTVPDETTVGNPTVDEGNLGITGEENDPTADKEEEGSPTVDGNDPNVPPELDSNLVEAEPSIVATPSDGGVVSGPRDGKSRGDVKLCHHNQAA